MKTILIVSVGALIGIILQHSFGVTEPAAYWFIGCMTMLVEGIVVDHAKRNRR